MYCLDSIETWLLGRSELGLSLGCFKTPRIYPGGSTCSDRHRSQTLFLPVLPSTTTCREEIPPLTVVTTMEQRLPDLREWKLYLLVSLETLSFLMTTFSWISKTWQKSMSPDAWVQLVKRLLVVPWLATCKPVTWAGTKTEQTGKKKQMILRHPKEV